MSIDSNNYQRYHQYIEDERSANLSEISELSELPPYSEEPDFSEDIPFNDNEIQDNRPSKKKITGRVKAIIVGSMALAARCIIGVIDADPRDEYYMSRRRRRRRRRARRWGAFVYRPGYPGYPNFPGCPGYPGCPGGPAGAGFPFC